MTHPRTGQVMDFDVLPLRYWTRSGAEYQAGLRRAEYAEGGLSGVVSFEVVGGLPPVVDVYADRFWDDGVYVGPEPPDW